MSYHLFYRSWLFCLIFWNLNIVLICISLRMLIIYFSAFQLFKYSFLRTIWFLIGLHFYLMSSFLGSLYILYNSPLSDVQKVKIISLYVNCCIIQLMVNFSIQKLFQFMNSHFSIIVHSSCAIIILFRDSICLFFLCQWVQWCSEYLIKFIENCIKFTFFILLELSFVRVLIMDFCGFF